MKKNLLFLLFFLALSTKSAFCADFIDKGFYIIDLKNKIEWLKCSAGQQWSDDEKKCLGQPVKLDQEEIKEANKMLNEQIEGEWRVPKRKELESIVCKKCEGVKIDTKTFPDTQPEPYWTSQRNWWSPKFFWSVNFFTGHSYGRFVPEKKLFVRFVRDR